MSALVTDAPVMTATRPARPATDTLVRCNHLGCPYPATKQMIHTQPAGGSKLRQTLRFCQAHAGLWAQRVMAKRGQRLEISDYPCVSEEN